jgi:hypothetical protein
MNFDPFKLFPKNSKVHWDSNPKVEIHLGMHVAHSLTLSCTPGSVNVTPKLHF